MNELFIFPPLRPTFFRPYQPRVNPIFWISLPKKEGRIIDRPSFLGVLAPLKKNV
jgi:hypothetical protein